MTLLLRRVSAGFPSTVYSPHGNVLPTVIDKQVAPTDYTEFFLPRPAPHTSQPMIISMANPLSYDWLYMRVL